MSLVFCLDVGGAAIDVTDTDPPMILLNSVLRALGLPANTALRNLAQRTLVTAPTNRGPQRVSAIAPEHLLPFVFRMPPDLLTKPEVDPFASALADMDFAAAVAAARRSLPAERDAWAAISLAATRVQAGAARLDRARVNQDGRDLMKAVEAIKTAVDAVGPAVARLARAAR